jgi:hypothetical protein
MSLLNKIKVRIKSRRQRPTPVPIQIEVREKEVFLCRGCSNRYHTHFRFCPECLGELYPAHPRTAGLLIVTVMKERIAELEQVLKSISGRKDFDFQKSLRSLPWLMIGGTDPAVLLHWQNVLNAEKVKSEIREIRSEKKLRMLKPRPPLYASGAPLPFFFSPATEAEVRTVSRQIQDPALRMKFVEIVLTGFGIVEGFYTKTPGNRILFSDFLYQIDHDLIEFCRNFHTYLKSRYHELEPALDKLKSQIVQMESEIHEVQKHVESQL